MTSRRVTSLSFRNERISCRILDVKGVNIITGNILSLSDFRNSTITILNGAAGNIRHGHQELTAPDHSPGLHTWPRGTTITGLRAWPGWHPFTYLHHHMGPEPEYPEFMPPEVLFFPAEEQPLLLLVSNYCGTPTGIYSRVRFRGRLQGGCVRILRRTLRIYPADIGVMRRRMGRRST
ncbi:hypothetical protein Tco_1291538 [Tanacetum coccineum]